MWQKWGFYHSLHLFRYEMEKQDRARRLSNLDISGEKRIQSNPWITFKPLLISNSETTEFEAIILGTIRVDFLVIFKLHEDKVEPYLVTG